MPVFDAEAILTLAPKVAAAHVRWARDRGGGDRGLSPFEVLEAIDYPPPPGALDNAPDQWAYVTEVLIVAWIENLVRAPPARKGRRRRANTPTSA